MRTKASVGGHPIHPMLVVFPLALYTVGLGTLIGYIVTREPFWFRVAYLSMIAGGALGLLAALFGAIDLIALPRDSRAKAVGVFHASAAVLSTALVLGAGLSMRTAWTDPLARTDFAVGFPLVLASAGLAVMLLAGALGWQLVGAHHVGVSPIPGHAGRIEPTSAPHSHVNALAVLRDQHAELDALLAAALATPPQHRLRLVRHLGDRFEIHALVEERLLYPTFATGAARPLFDNYAREHRQLRATLAALCELPTIPTSALESLSAVLAHHEHADEESQLFALVEQTLSTEQLDTLGAELLALTAELSHDTPWRALEADARHPARF